jgi:hypothetical protein
LFHYIVKNAPKTPFYPIIERYENLQVCLAEDVIFHFALSAAPLIKKRRIF